MNSISKGVSIPIIFVAWRAISNVYWAPLLLLIRKGFSKSLRNISLPVIKGDLRFSRAWVIIVTFLSVLVTELMGRVRLKGLAEVHCLSNRKYLDLNFSIFLKNNSNLYFNYLIRIVLFI